jgi:hypothetical protein
MAAPTFDVLRPTITRVEKPTLPVATALVPFVDPTSALPLLLGEWMVNTNSQLARPGTGANVEIAAPTFPYWEWTGQTDVQSSLKGTVLYPTYEAWTMAWDYLTNPPVTHGDPLSTAVMPPGHAWAGYAVPRISTVFARTNLIFVIGWAIGPIPTANGQRLTFRANY